MKRPRSCRHSTCFEQSVATLTFDYADSTVVLGPLSINQEPSAYDLCARHAEIFTPPRGWEVIRLAVESVPSGPSREDLEALAATVRTSGRHLAAAPYEPLRLATASRHGHLRVVRGERD